MSEQKKTISKFNLLRFSHGYGQLLNLCAITCSTHARELDTIVHFKIACEAKKKLIIKIVKEG
jgi:hypothetical protein